MGRFATDEALLTALNGTEVMTDLPQQRHIWELLRNTATRNLLLEHGLELSKDGDLHRANTASLQQAVTAIWEARGRLATWAQSHPLLDRRDLRLLVISMRELPATALPEIAVHGLVNAGQVSIRLASDEPDLPPQDDETDGQFAHKRGLETVIARLDTVQLDRMTLLKTTLPLLKRSHTRGLAARLLGQQGAVEAVTHIEHALAKSSLIQDRLECLEALVKLGQQEQSMRTLRSMLIHGTTETRRLICDHLARIATVEHSDALYKMMTAVDGDARIRLAGMLYGLGDSRAFVALRDAVLTLNAASSSSRVTVVLQTIETLGSQRFIGFLRSYAEREERAWFLKRATTIADRLMRYGKDEPPVEELRKHAERLWRANRSAEAFEVIERLLELDPLHEDGLHLKANFHKELGDFDVSLEVVNQALTTHPRAWRLHRLRGSLLWDTGCPQDALAAYDSCLALNPTDPFAWYYKGYVLYRLEHYGASLPCLDRALSLKNDSAYIHNQKAFCLERLGDLDGALMSYQRSLRLNPMDLYTREYCGQVLERLGRLTEALYQFEWVLSAKPQHHGALYHRAQVLQRLKRYETAGASYEQFLASNPDHFRAWFNLGLCYRNRAIWAKAAQCFERALTIRPQSISARHQIEFCRRR